MQLEPKKKARSRKGKCNVWRQLATANMAAEESSSSAIVNTNVTSSNAHSSKIFKPLENKSASKLKNSNFKKVKTTVAAAFKQTRSHSAGNTVHRNMPCVGNGIISLDLLAAALQQSAICSKCKHPDSRLNLLETRSKRKGLCQSFVIKCSRCPNKTNFKSSKATGKVCDINVKSVHASCQSTDHAGLEKLTAQLDLPKPVSKKPYSKIVKDLSYHAKPLAEAAMSEAAERLFNCVTKISYKGV